MTEDKERAWIHCGFEEFSRGQFDNGGDNLYVNASGIIERIHRLDVNNDGHVDLVFSNSHGYLERGPTWIYTQAAGAGADWPRQQLENDSGWMSRAADVDGDGYLDLIVVNGENGVTSELDSYVYWGGPHGLTGERTELPTAGAYDVAAVDLRGVGRLDLIFPSAWVDHHNPGAARLIQVYEQVEPRTFAEVSTRYGLEGIAAVGVACEDLNGDGRPELVVANYREEFEYDIDSFVYWGTEDGFDASAPLRLPSHFALQVVLGDLDGDGFKEIIFSGGNQIYIYWNRGGNFRPGDVEIIETEGNSTMFAQGAVRTAVADVDGDGNNELLVAALEGIEIRARDDLQKVRQLLPLKYSDWVEAVDLDDDGRPELVVSRYQDGRNYETDSAIFWNGPAGLSTERATYLPSGGAVGATAADLDGDGRPEIIFNNTMGGPSQINPDFPLYVYLGNQENDYDPARRLELPTGGGTNTHILADLNQNDFADLVFNSPEGLRIFHGGPDGLQPQRYTILSTRAKMTYYVLVGDFDKDGWLDLLAIAYTYDDKPETLANSSQLFYGGPDGFSPERSVVVPTFCGGNAQIADVDQDGWLDLIVYNKRGYLSIYLGGPDGFCEERMWKIPLEAPGAGGVACINCADLNGNGYLDLIAVIMGHYTRGDSGFFILHGGPDGYSPERTEFHPTDASSIMVSVADLNNNGHLDLLVPAYSTKFTRELPAYIFWGNDRGFDFDNPLAIPCDSSCAFLAVDISGNGYKDLLAVCHRNDLGHQVESLLFWNGPEGLSFDQVSRLPALGPHLSSPRDFGNAYSREPLENYISPAYNTEGRKPLRLSWTAKVPAKTQLKFQLRWAPNEQDLENAPWTGPDGKDSFYQEPGTSIAAVDHQARWLQYKAALVSLNGCLSPGLEEVRVDFENQKEQTT
jgi:hypothetical protein